MKIPVILEVIHDFLYFENCFEVGIRDARGLPLGLEDGFVISLLFWTRDWNSCFLTIIDDRVLYVNHLKTMEFLLCDFDCFEKLKFQLLSDGIERNVGFQVGNPYEKTLPPR